MAVESRLERFATVFFLTVTGHGDERHLRQTGVFAEAFGNFVPVHLGQTNIQEDDLGLIFASRS